MFQKTTIRRSLFYCIDKIVPLMLLIVLAFSTNAFSGPYINQLGLNTVELGFANFYRCGSYNPLRLKIHSGRRPIEGDISLELQDADGAKYRVPIGPISMPFNSEKIIETSIQVARKPCEIKVVYRPNLTLSVPDNIEAEAEWNWIDPAPLDHALVSTQGILLEVGPSVGLTRLAPSPKRSSASDQKPLNAISLASAAMLPSDVRSWESISGAVLTLRLDDPKSHPNKEQCAAIEEWIRGGGQLLICATSKTDNLEQPLPESLQRLLPGEMSELVPVQTNIPWETLINSDLPIPGSTVNLKTYIAKWKNVRGKVLLEDEDVPLAVETSLGLGKVVVASLSFTEPPISAWANNQKLLRRLSPWHWPSEEELAGATSNQSNRLGYNDISGQLFVTMNRFPAATFPSFWMILIGGILIAMAWYPLQAIWMNRLQSPLARWGILIGVMGALVFVSWKGTERDREQPISLNQVEVVDVHIGAGRLQSHSWAAFFSPNPQMTTTQFSLPAGLQSASVTNRNASHIGWLGLPGKGWGGIDSQTVSPVSADEPYEIGDQKLANLVFPTGAVKTFRGDWSHNFEPDKIQPLFKKPTESHVNGLLKNRTGKTLNRAVLYYEKWALELGTIKPDQELNVADYHSTIWSRESALVERRIDKAPYKPEAVDQRVIVNMMMMHRAAGSNRFTGLSNNVATHLDQSDALTENQAILIGWSDEATDWSVNSLEQRIDSRTNAGQDRKENLKTSSAPTSGEIAQKNVAKQNLTAYRFFLPVEVLKANQTEDAGIQTGSGERNATELRFPQNIFSTPTSEPKRETNP